jgi:sulfotransferase family protein
MICRDMARSRDELYPDGSAGLGETAARRDLLFVCGLHRSGTSLVHRSIAAHPHVSGFKDTGVPEDEGQHLQSVYPPARKYGGAGVFGFHPEAHLTETSPLATEANSILLLREWARHWRPDAEVWVEKSPPNIIRTRFLQALFPDARFLVIVRHPVAVAGATKKWAHTSWRSLIDHWVKCHDILAADAPHIRRLRLVRYEDFVSAPDARLADIFRWLRLEPRRGNENVVQEVNQRYARLWESRGRLLGRLDRRLAISRYDRPVARWGYSLRDPDFLGPCDVLGHRSLDGAGR